MLSFRVVPASVNWETDPIHIPGHFPGPQVPGQTQGTGFQQYNINQQVHLGIY